ncbi:MAG TPA: 3D domain-containing protein [bacterium]|jgi:uncharacterized protein YabE (DUF348 family)
MFSKFETKLFNSANIEAVIAAVCLIIAISGAGFVFFGGPSILSPEKEVMLIVDGQSDTLYTKADTVGRLLKSRGITPKANDMVAPPPETPLTTGLTVSYRGAVEIELINGTSRPDTFTSSAGSICEFLEESGIMLGPFDRVTPDPDAALEDGMTVEVTYVDVVDITSENEIAPPLVVEPDPDLRRGTMIEEDPGTPGIEQDVTRIYYRNGVESTRFPIGSRVLLEPTPRVARIGTHSMPPLASRGDLVSRNVIQMVATGYDPSPASCYPFADGFTATGHPAGHGVCAVDPSVIPLGTQLWIEGYGYALACDTGGAIKGNRIDVCFDTHSEAISWGRRTVLVYILD